MSYLLLKLEKKNILYKLLPIFFLITIVLPRGVAEYESTLELDYLVKYWIYVKYILVNFAHFFSLYVFGMYCSSHKDIIDRFYDKRILLWILMIFLSGVDIYLQYRYQVSNYTVSKTILTMLILGYLKHYDEFILSHNKTNKTLDFIAKYSFGLFFVHWYLFFIYNQIFNLQNVAPILNENIMLTIGFVFLRFVFVALASIACLYAGKKVLLAINKDVNTRMFFGV